MQISGHAALVTGGGSGLGAATARALKKAGAKVAIIDINAEQAGAVAAGIGALALTANVADAAQMDGAIAKAAAAHGPARILVACAGIAPGARILGREGPHDLDLFRKVIEVNLVGTFNLMRLGAAAMAGLPALEDGERGVIINTASIAAFEGQVGQAAYAASKGAVAGLTLPAARELARAGIRVVTIAPGLMDTPMLAGMPPQVKESLLAQTIFPQRLGTGEDYAALALSIIANPLLNGSTIRLDGAVRLAAK